MKIVLVGAGSQSFGRGQIVDVLRSEELEGRDVTLTLVDTNEAALKLMHDFGRLVTAHTQTDVALEATPDRREALVGADYVITSVARKRRELWEQDYRVPRAYGFNHCYGENGGPGALFHALRSLELIIPICRDVEELCPRALLLNFTNPEARVLQAIYDLTQVKAAGICHGVFAAIEAIAHYLSRPVAELEVTSAGMNHLYCVLRVIDKKTGKDLHDELIEKVLTVEPPPSKYHHDVRLFKKMAEIFGVFTYPSDCHFGEYLGWGSTYCGRRWRRGVEWRAVSLSTSAPGPSLADYATGKVPLDEHILRRTAEITVPVICDIELDRGNRREAVNVMNRDGYIENLPTDAVIEVPARVDARGLHPEKVGPLPEPFAAIIRMQLSINKLVAEGYRTKSKKLLLQALLLDPYVNSVTAADEMLDEMLELQKAFLPTFS